ncbi:class I SAM-dependent methyltransferase [Pelagibacterium montanilacus]|uniref:class I SAM-dependent methyltransferase n=1 Tax=Pelagibacterium montanilacus TaxID=2185280 RepID=UPI000F8E3007|nr:class I SAM-dependent methyltransferase [Pelagibacterium montanilacus]
MSTPPAASAFGASHAGAYASSARRTVPGLDALHRMVGLLLAEAVPETGRVLVLGAGGGLELAALAAARPGWRFDGVDPSADMLAAAARTTSAHRDRIALHEGYAGDAPAGPFDGAVCLLTLHFVPRTERIPTLSALRARLAPGAPLVLAHMSMPPAADDPDAGRRLWLARNLAFAGTEPAAMAPSIATMAERLTILSPHEDEADLSAAGFSGAALFYAALGFRGWVCRA